MLQLVYISSAQMPIGNIGDVLLSSRRNNTRDQITGLLYADQGRFLQALEGPEDAVDATFQRIRQDDRHFGVVVLSRRTVDVREFGEWAMAHRSPGQAVEPFLARVERLVSKSDPVVAATFTGLVRHRTAA